MEKHCLQAWISMHSCFSGRKKMESNNVERRAHFKLNLIPLGWSLFVMSWSLSWQLGQKILLYKMVASILNYKRQGKKIWFCGEAIHSENSFQCKSNNWMLLAVIVNLSQYHVVFIPTEWFPVSLVFCISLIPANATLCIFFSNALLFYLLSVCHMQF